MGSAIQRIESKLWPILNFYTSSTGHIAGWCVTVGMVSGVGWMFVHVILWCNVCVMNMRRRRLKGNVEPALTYSFGKVRRGPPGLTSPSDERIAINSTCAFTLCAVRWDLRFNPAICGTDTSDWGSAPPSLPVQGRKIFIKHYYPARDWNRDHCRQGSDSATVLLRRIALVSCVGFLTLRWSKIPLM